LIIPPPRKLMVAVIWDRKRELMVELIQKGITIKSEVYCETLKIQCRAIKNRRRGMLTYGIVPQNY
jgi:hypothetical protein